MGMVAWVDRYRAGARRLHDRRVAGAAEWPRRGPSGAADDVQLAAVLGGPAADGATGISSGCVSHRDFARLSSGSSRTLQMETHVKRNDGVARLPQREAQHENGPSVGDFAPRAAIDPGLGPSGGPGATRFACREHP